MHWALRVGMLIAPTENACLEILILSIHSTCDDIFLPSLLSPTVLIYTESIIVQTTHAHVCYAFPGKFKNTFHCLRVLIFLDLIHRLGHGYVHGKWKIEDF